MRQFNQSQSSLHLPSPSGLYIQRPHCYTCWPFGSAAAPFALTHCADVAGVFIHEMINLKPNLNNSLSSLLLTYDTDVPVIQSAEYTEHFCFA